MKNITLVLFVFLINFIGFSQCPTSDIILLSQEEIDDFSSNYPNCSTFTHNLKIDGESSNITNLNGLSLVTNAQEILIIRTQIDDFSGLNNLVDIASLSIWINPNLSSLEGLSSIQTVGGLEMFVNNGLISLSGLDSLQSLESLSLFDNSNLSDISQLSFLETITYLNISGNSFNDLAGLENLETIQGDLIVSNESLQNFNEFSNLQSIGGSLYITSNDEIEDLTAFNNIVSLENLYITNCPNLLDTYSLENLQTISGRLRIGFNSSLLTMNIFDNITSVGDIDIYQNDNLISLKGLENLEEINQRLLINDNPVLTNLNGISNVSPSEADEVIILSNPNLSFCNNPFICGIIDDPAVSKTIMNNATGCNSVVEVQEICLLLGIEEDVLFNDVMVFPNPVSEKITISMSEQFTYNRAFIYSVLGEKIFETSEFNIDFSSWAAGTYFVEINTNQGIALKRIVKE